MRIRNSALVPFLLTLLSTPSTIVAQGTTPNGNIVPFSTLPACAANCGHLYDAQGACSPPIQSNNLVCFCNDSRVSGLATGQNVCANNPCDAADIATIAAWFQSICAAATSPTTAVGGAATTATDGSSQATGANSAGSNSGSGSTAGSTWLSTHWQYVVMLVVLIVGIAGLWVAAVLLRRRYNRKRETQYEMRPPGAPWVAGQPPMVGVVGNGKNKEMTGVPMQEKEKEKKRWIVKERT